MSYRRRERQRKERQQLHCVKREGREGKKKEWEKRQREKSDIGPMNLWRVLVETHTSLSESLPPTIHTRTAYSKRHTKVRHREKEKEREREREQSLLNTGHWVSYSNIILFSIYIPNIYIFIYIYLYIQYWLTPIKVFYSLLSQIIRACYCKKKPNEQKKQNNEIKKVDIHLAVRLKIKERHNCLLSGLP